METIKRENIQLGDNRKLVATMATSGSIPQPLPCTPPKLGVRSLEVRDDGDQRVRLVPQLAPTNDESVQPSSSPASHRGAWFRKSNTCGSLYVQCACKVTTGHCGKSRLENVFDSRSKQHPAAAQKQRPISLSDKDIRRVRPQSFVHPDSPTTVYGEAGYQDALEKALTSRTSVTAAQTTCGGYEVLHTATAVRSKRYSTPAIGTSYAFHPEFVLQKLQNDSVPATPQPVVEPPKVSPPTPDAAALTRVVFKQRHCASYPGFQENAHFGKSLSNGTSNASSLDVGCSWVEEDSATSQEYLADVCERTDDEDWENTPPLASYLSAPLGHAGTSLKSDGSRVPSSNCGRGPSRAEVLIDSGSSKLSSVCGIPARKGNEYFGGVRPNGSKLSVSLDSVATGTGRCSRAGSSPPSSATHLLTPLIPIPAQLNYSAKEYLIQSGILGPMGNGSSLLLRKTSKIVPNIDTPVKERIRKNSVKLWGKVLTEDRRKSLSGQCDSLQSYGSVMTVSGEHTLEDELNSLRRLLRARDEEIDKLRSEIDKLKSVLKQKAVNSLEQSNVVTAATEQHQKPALGSPTGTPTSGKGSRGVAERELLSSIQANYAMAGQPLSELFGTSGNSFTLNQMKSVKGITLQAMKKQGVSGESCDLMGSQSSDIKVPKYKKDFSAKQLIKDAIMENDFFKNIDSLQIREIVDSMYSREFRKGEYVIRAGDAGSHLYVSAAGEFEVIKDGKVLGAMGPGRAFGELAILYNCTRTASIRVLCDSRVWVLDRRVFQQIMMRTGMQRIEENVNFLKSVPLLKHLSNDVLTKIADVLEVEFYPAGAYIIRQGAAGDTFFLISQGTVKVTQRLPGRAVDEEIRILVRGEYFGEQALIREDKRTANIIAMSPGVECLTLDRESFTKHIGDLCELQEKNYGDEERVLAFRNLENTQPSLGSCQPELMDVNLADLDVIGTLGVGGFGRVELVKVEHAGNTQVYALKCMKKRHIVDTRQQEHMYSERKIMLACHSPFICRLYRTYKDSKYAYMLLEACMGGEVWTILRDRVTFEDSTAKFIVGCVLQAFDFLHARGIVYRDLKPENLLLDARGYAKLVDFGFSKFIGYSSKTWTFCGTPEYVAPEIILNKGHDRSVDYWALGILIHELLTGIPPFTAADPMKTYNIILKGIDMVSFPKHMSRAAVSLIKRLCRDVPSERLGYQRGGVQDIKKHKWFQGFDWDGLIALTLKSPLQPNLKGPLDMSNFDIFPKDLDIPPDELSGWDADF
ncbi:cGMP-dependent protein kinase, isozyme 1-like [Anopheles cruzii]|uniref:cGMP-dependent protein kinase, isozyme 1-like n=1 Tax=Anopheles cruzii TaxID=68878 RepID=UPI0022EC530F|nr:cGMP-dependent protein kinase, isozyme 1-like [Anopheles cruzii]